MIFVGRRCRKIITSFIMNYDDFLCKLVALSCLSVYSDSLKENPWLEKNAFWHLLSAEDQIRAG